MTPETPRALSLRDAFRVSDDVVFRDVGGEAVILDLKNGTYFGLDAVGTRIWRVLTEGATLAEALEVIVSEYDVPRTIAERDLLDLVADLCRRQLIHPQD